MAQDVRNATRPYGGYDRRPSTTPDRELAEVGRGTPAGEYLRRFWQPVALAADIKDLPVPITILGEELVVFRDRSGALGLLERHCSHRRTSLEFALIVDHGLRCAYHGWHYGVDGALLDGPGEKVPGEKVPGALASRMYHGAYPVREFRGLVFAYMGPPDQRPPFPDYDFMHHDEEEYLPFCWHNPCNWVQLRENTQDPIHLTFLHSMFDVQQFGDYAYDLPVIQACETPIGQITTSVRRVHDLYYCRVNELILPNIARVPDGIRLGDAIPENMAGEPGRRQAIELRYRRQLPSSHGLGLSTWIVPNDDFNAMHMGWLHLSPKWSEKARADYLATITFGQTGERSYEERHRNPGDWDAWVAQGRMAIQANENLTAADAGIALFRRQLRAGIRAVQAGERPKGMRAEGEGVCQTYGYALTRPAPCLPDEGAEWAAKQDYAQEMQQDILAAHLLPKASTPAVVRAFAPVIQLSQGMLLLAARPGLGVSDAAGLVALAKKRPGLSYGSPGSGSPMHIAGELFNRAAGVSITHVPYKGTAPAITDLLGGHIDLIYGVPGSLWPHVQAGKMVALGVVQPTRSPLLPQVPTLEEQGVKGLDVTTWYGMLAPAGTPAPVVARLNREVAAILAEPDVQKEFRAQWEVPVGGSAEDFTRRTRDDYRRAGAIVAEFGIRLD